MSQKKVKQPKKITDNDITYYFEKSSFLKNLVNIIKELFIPFSIIFITCFITSIISGLYYVIKCMIEIILNQEIMQSSFAETYKPIIYLITVIISIIAIYIYGTKTVYHYALKLKTVSDNKETKAEYAMYGLIIITGIYYIILNLLNPKHITPYATHDILQLIGTIISPILIELLRFTICIIISKLTNNFWALITGVFACTALIAIGTPLIMLIPAILYHIVFTYSCVKNRDIKANIFYAILFNIIPFFYNNLSVTCTIILIASVILIIKIKINLAKKRIDDKFEKFNK